MTEENNIEDLLGEFDKFAQDRTFPILESQDFIPPWAETTKQLFPPFTYFGGKRGIAHEVWRRFGADIPNYIEPFCGGLAVLLARPLADLRDLTKYRELANDTNILLLNFWRSIQQKKIDEIINLMEFPAHEVELLARRSAMLHRRHKLEMLVDDVTKCDPELAAYWLYCQRQWIGGGADDAKFEPRLKMVRAVESGVQGDSLNTHLRYMQERTRHVRFFAKEWDRALESDTQTKNIGKTAVFLDPPYLNTTHYYKGRLDETHSDNKVPLDARKWALEKGDDPEMRIAYCGYLHHHEDFFPEGKNGWRRISWKISNGYAKPGQDKEEQIETIWFSPHCLSFQSDVENEVIPVDGELEEVETVE